MNGLAVSSAVLELLEACSLFKLIPVIAEMLYIGYKNNNRNIAGILGKVLYNPVIFY